MFVILFFVIVSAFIIGDSVGGLLHTSLIIISFLVMNVIAFYGARIIRFIGRKIISLIYKGDYMSIVDLPFMSILKSLIDVTVRIYDRRLSIEINNVSKIYHYENIDLPGTVCSGFPRVLKFRYLGELIAVPLFKFPDDICENIIVHINNSVQANKAN